MKKKYILSILMLVSLVTSYYLTFESDLKKWYNNHLQQIEQEKQDAVIAAKLKEPENQAQIFVTRMYKQSDDENSAKVKIIEPKDSIVAQELTAILGIKLIIPDEYYWLPSREFVTKKLLPLYKKYKEEKHFVYSTKFDCDDFSRNFSIFAQSVYTDLVINKNMEAICVGELYYVPDPLRIFFMNGDFLNPLTIQTFPQTQNHAINIIILDDMSVMFIEPQIGEEVNLSTTERKNIVFCKF